MSHDRLPKLRRRRGPATWLHLPGASGNYASTPDAAVLDITGNIDIRVHVAPDDWTPGSTSALCAKRLNTGNQCSWRLVLNTGGTLSLHTSPDGAAANEVTGTSTAAPTISNGEPLWVRVTLDVDDGSSNRVYNFYTSTDGSSWAALGSTVTESGTTSIHAGTALLELGSINTGTAQLLAGRVMNAQVYDGIAGTKVFDANFTTGPLGAESVTDTANDAVVTINTSGGDPAKLTGAWR